MGEGDAHLLALLVARRAANVPKGNFGADLMRRGRNQGLMAAAGTLGLCTPEEWEDLAKLHDEADYRRSEKLIAEAEAAAAEEPDRMGP